MLKHFVKKGGLLQSEETLLFLRMLPANKVGERKRNDEHRIDGHVHPKALYVV